MELVSEKEKDSFFFNPNRDEGGFIAGLCNNSDIGTTTGWDEACKAWREKPKYEFLESVLMSTPDQYSILQSSKEMVRLFVLLSLKGSLLHGPAGSGMAVYSFSTEHIRGFQLGDPAKARLVRVIGFDRNDKEFEFVVEAEGDFPPLSQAELNQILQTTRLADAGAAKALSDESPANRSWKRLTEAGCVVHHRGCMTCTEGSK